MRGSTSTPVGSPAPPAHNPATGPIGGGGGGTGTAGATQSSGATTGLAAADDIKGIRERIQQDAVYLSVLDEHVDAELHAAVSKRMAASKLQLEEKLPLDVRAREAASEIKLAREARTKFHATYEKRVKALDDALKACTEAEEALAAAEIRLGRAEAALPATMAPSQGANQSWAQVV